MSLPQFGSFDFAEIPTELRGRVQWVVWRFVNRDDGRVDKVPFRPDGQAANTTAPESWTTYSDVVAAYSTGKFAGIGYVFSENDPYIGIDLDGCRDPGTSVIDTWALEVIEACGGTYAEISPSQTGVKLIGVGRSPFASGKNVKLPQYGERGGKNAGIEIYARARYFALTGWRLPAANSEPCEIPIDGLECVRRLIESAKTKKRTGKPVVATNEATRPMRHGLLDRCRNYISKMPPAISGNSGHDATFAVACKLYQFGLSDVQAGTLLDEYNQRCEPPWSDAELRHKLDSARQAVESEGKIGCMSRNDENATPDSRDRPTQSGKDGERPEVELAIGEHEVVANVLPALAELGWTICPASPDLRTYQRGGALVHVVTDASSLFDIKMPDGMKRIRPLPPILLRERVGKSVRLFNRVETDSGPVCKPARPPNWLVSMIHERGEFPPAMRHLAGVVQCPTMRPDGSIVQNTGYDAATGLLVELSGQWPTLPESPTHHDAVRAVADLLAVVEDFPFAGPPHRSGWLALVLTLVARSAICGPCPLFVLDANTRGSGKSLAADAAAIIAMGSTLPRKSWTADENETRKMITATALETLPVVLFDNVAGQLGCPSLEAALTGTTWSDRLLGLSRTTGTLPLTTVWVATGNNVAFSGDTSRRTLLVRLESPLECPEERAGFAHSDLLAWVKAERRQLVVAALTILRGYVVAGRPDQRLPPWGSYEAWSELVRNAIAWAGLRDPAETRAITREADRSTEMLQLIHVGILEVSGENGITTAEIIRLINAQTQSDLADSYPTLRAAVGELCGAKPNAQKLGIELRKYVGRVCDGKRLVRDTDSHGKVASWQICGDCGDLRGLSTANLNAKSESVCSGEAPARHENHNKSGAKMSPQVPAVPASDCCGIEVPT